jgi:microcin C transport system substrate-binding protein
VALNFFPPPGPELRSYFGAAAADVRGSANISGIKDPVVDALIEKIVAAEDLESLKAASRALDRVLSWGFYVVPHFYNGETWIAYWDKFGHPERNPRYGVAFPGAWWIDETRAAQLKN